MAATLSAQAAYLVTTVDSPGSTGIHTSLALNGGNPVVSYLDSTNGDLKLATCTAGCATATPTWVITTVDSAGNVGYFTSLELNGGNPVVSYHDLINGDLKLATCTAGCATATPTWVITTVDSAGNVGEYTSLALNGGNPVVSYRDVTNGDLKLATCTAGCATATPTWVITTVDSVGNVGEYTSLALNGGNPVVSYLDSTNSDLKLATCTAGCATATPTWVITPVDSAGVVSPHTTLGRHTSLALNGGNPVVSYSHIANLALKLATCTAGCASATPTWVITTVDSVGSVGQHTSLALDGGNPVVSYFDVGNGDLKLAICTADCATATPIWAITTVDSAGNVGLFTSLELNGGNPVVSYYDLTNGDLKLATFIPTAVTTFSGPSATGSGTITASFTGGGTACTYATSEFIPLTGHARSPPTGSAPAVTFPHGLFDFTLSGCTPGSTVAFTITYPAALGPGTRYYKYGPTPGTPTPHWYVLPAAIAGNTATFSITDGALGDDDLAANGTIVDQGGPGDPGGAGLRQVPTLSEWALLLMATLMMLTAMMAMNRRVRK